MSNPFKWNSPYASVRSPLFARNVVSTSHPLAAQAGLRMLAQGGNAVDAAIATAACMTLVEPCSNGLGSDAFCILWDGTQLHGLNASGTAPAAWTPEHFFKTYGPDLKAPPKRGWGGVTVPGAVAGWVALSERFGRLPFADLMAPAIEIAERGYAVPVIVQSKWAMAAALPELTGQPGFAQAFMPRGRAPEVGELFKFPDAARTLRLIAQTKGEAFYRGEVAEAVQKFARETGGAMTAADMADYRPEWVTPISQSYAGHELHEIPPNGQGIAALIALGILKHLDLPAQAVDGVAAQHMQIEAMKLAFADVYRYVSDARSMEVTASEMLDPAYLAQRAKLVDMGRAQDFKAGNPVKGGTIYLTTADESGMMVSFIQSNYMGFGSGLVVPGYGLSLQNRGHCFTLQDGHPNQVAPGKRPFHTIIPAFLTAPTSPAAPAPRGGVAPPWGGPATHEPAPTSPTAPAPRGGVAPPWGGPATAPSHVPVMSFGVMGGNMQPQGHMQTLVRMLDFGQHPQAACDAPRWRFNEGLSINVEPHMPAATIEGLRSLGHRIADIHDSYQDFGAGQFIWSIGDPEIEGYVAASDPRRDGAAVGY